MPACLSTFRIIVTASERPSIATYVLGASVQSAKPGPLLASPVATERGQRIRDTRSVPVATGEAGENPRQAVQPPSDEALQADFGQFSGCFAGRALMFVSIQRPEAHLSTASVTPGRSPVPCGRDCPDVHG